MTANVNNILRQIDTVSDQVLGLAVLSSEFENYSEKSKQVSLEHVIAICAVDLQKKRK